MTTEELVIEFTEALGEEFLKFDRVQQKLSSRPDIHAFILLNKLVPSGHDIVVNAAHDEIWLDVDPTDLARVANEHDIVDLVRCGVRYDEEYSSLAMFV